nr:DivIVA domain-containing protein [Nocardia transvalensis]
MFGKAPFGNRGYDTAEVDAFCDRVAAAFRGRATLTAADIREHEFSTAARGRRGYDRDEVDDYLDRICVELESVRRGAEPSAAGDTLPLTPEDIQRLRFSAPPTGSTGYDADEVHVFLDRIAATLAHAGSNGLTSADVRAVDFAPALAGAPACHRDEVDAFLDVVVRMLTAEEASGRS